MRIIPYLSILVSSLIAIPSLAQEPGNEPAGETASTMVSIPFVSSSATFHPSEEEASLLGDIRDATMVSIAGRTSTNRASARDESLALARAISARSWLVAHGVSPLKVMINYVSAADFVADNSTAVGRAQNQRVDIEVFYVSKP
jgi:outer membrane protein OmpA-like peptidoglycan-associated protein